MGYYINPVGVSKRDYLEQNGKKQDIAPNWSDVPEGMVAVCLVQNGVISAAGICYSENELKAFKGDDGRKKEWFIITVEAAKAASDW